jgi:ankyrin repeat protein
MIVASGIISVNALDTYGQNALHYATESSDPAIMKLLLISGCCFTMSIGKYSQNPLHIAVKNGHTEVAEAIIEESRINKDIDLNSKRYDGMTVLMLAAAKGHQRIVCNLLEHGVKKEITREKKINAFYLAVKANNDGIA